MSQSRHAGIKKGGGVTTKQTKTFNQLGGSWGRGKMMMEAIRMEMKTEVMRMKMKTEDSPLKLATFRPVERRGGAGGCDRLLPQGGFPE